jgi:hypothetical protein
VFSLCCLKAINRNITYPLLAEKHSAMM